MSVPSSFNHKHKIIYDNNVLEFQIIRTQRRRKTNEILIEYGNVSVPNFNIIILERNRVTSK